MDIKTIQALALAKKYADDLLKGQGAIKGEKGDPFTYEDFTQEQLENLKGPKGDPGAQGAPFTYDMFTEEQLNSLKGKDGSKGEKGDIGPQGPKGDSGATGPQGPKGDTGAQGPKGEAFTYKDFTEEQLESLKGESGNSPHIGENGNWYIGDQDTGVSASGANNINLNAIPMNNIDFIISQTSTLNDNLEEMPVKYYKIEFNNIYSTNGKTDPKSAALTELEFYDKNGNKILPFLISASSVYQDSDSYSANKLIDGKFTTMWSSKNIDETHWLEITFPEPIILSQIKIAPRDGMEHGVPDTLSFYASEDKGIWYQIGYFENLKDTWVDKNTFQDFNLNPYKTDLNLQNQFLNFNGLRYYHMNHGALKANINSPAFTGNPTAETPELDNDSNRLATTKFVQDLFKNSGATMLNKELAARAHEERMQEWSKLGLGLFIHWGVYAAWDGKYQGLNELGEKVNVNITYNAEWLLCRSKMPIETYKSKSNYFTGELWNAEEIAKMAYQAGMKYIVITSKHHEGFSLFPNENSSWDIDDTPCRNTVLQELKDACEKYGLKFCLYFSQCYDWTEEGGFGKEQSAYLGSDPWTEEQHMSYLEKTIKSIQYLIKTYDPYVLWYDMGFSDKKYYQPFYEAQELYWPNVIVNDRLANNRNLFGDFATPERTSGNGLDKYCEACFTLNNTWGYNSSNDILSAYNSMDVEKIFKDFILDSIGKGQNCLLNIGPKPDGSIPEMQKSRLRFMSKFFQKYGTITGGSRANKMSYPDWGYMIKTDDKTLKCFIFEPNISNINLYGFDPTYITSVRVYDAENEYSENNYEKTEFGIKLFNPLNSYSETEYINTFDTTITNNANIGVVEIKFSQPIIILEAKPLDTSGCIRPRCFSINKYATKNYRNDQLSLFGKGYCSTEFIWTGDSGTYNISKSINVGTDTVNTGKITIINCNNGKRYVFELENLANDNIEESIALINGFRYKIEIERINGNVNAGATAIILNKISFEPANENITYTEVDHITAKQYQYIDTNFMPSNNTKVEVDFMQTAKNTSRMGIVAGLEEPRFILGTDTQDNKLRYDFGTMKEQYTDNNSYPILNNRYVMALDKGKCYVNGVELPNLDMSSSGGEFQATSSLWLFADSGYNQNNVKFIGNIYSAKIWENDELVRDFIPVKRDFDGIYGMLDRVNNKFYSSCTSNNFTYE